MGGKRQFGHTQKLPSGRWQAFYRYAEQRHKAHTTFETKMDAEAWLVDERRLPGARGLDPARGTTPGERRC